jgi:hypothetical protein
MAKFSSKSMGKENGAASVYAEPHGKANKTPALKDPNTLRSQEMGPDTAVPRVSMGDPAKDDVERDGIETRGNGAATKGRIARGPMA